MNFIQELRHQWLAEMSRRPSPQEEDHWCSDDFLIVWVHRGGQSWLVVASVDLRSIISADAQRGLLSSKSATQSPIPTYRSAGLSASPMGDYFLFLAAFGFGGRPLGSLPAGMCQLCYLQLGHRLGRLFMRFTHA